MYNFKFEPEKCWYKNICENECLPSCLRYLEMDYLMKTSNIPEKCQYPVLLVPESEDLEAFNVLADIKEDIVNFVNNGENLYIFSNNFGNGKTTWSIKIMCNYFNLVWAGNGFKRRGLFINVPTFLTRLKNNISNYDSELAEIKQYLTEVDLVIWDDIGSGKLSDFDHTNLLSYIDERILQNKSNIYTSNLNYEQLIKCVGNRIASRIINSNCTYVQLVGGDRR